MRHSDSDNFTEAIKSCRRRKLDPEVGWKGETGWQDEKCQRKQTP